MTHPVFLHVALNCRDLTKTGTFYETYFGFRTTRTVEAEGGQIVFLSSDSVSLELFKADGEPPDGDPKKDGVRHAGYRHIAFQVGDIDEKIAEMGGDAEITLGPLDLSRYAEGWRVVWVRDPDGRIVEISQGYRA